MGLIEIMAAGAVAVALLSWKIETSKWTISIIGVCGMGRVGKTILVKNLNNELLNIAASGYKLSFGLMVWVTVPKVQTKIINRIDVKVDDKKSIPNIANKLHQMLKQEMSFVLILDDAWQMRTYTETKVYTMNEDESWQLFVKKAEDDASLEHIQPFAKAIARECNGLPLAIAVIGASVRRKKRVELWNYSLESLGMSEPHNKYVKDKVYMVIKWSFDSLESQDIELALEQRSKHMNKSLKKRGDIQSCFLYCSSYPMAIPTDDLIHVADGQRGSLVNVTHEEAYNGGITMIESLKATCLKCTS